MEPNYSGYNGQGLTSPTSEGAGASRPAEKHTVESYPEQAWPPVIPEAQFGYPPAGMPLPAVGNNSVPSYQVPVAPDKPSETGVSIVSPTLADDADLIEKEWVEAVKQIVVKTQGDPYSQSRAMNVLRADYMKKRYNKDVKVPKDER